MNSPVSASFPAAQRGTALVIGLIMMAMLMVVVVSGYKTTRISLDIVNNMQISNQSLAAADATIEEALSTVRMFQTPGTVFLNPCGANNTRCFDLNEDGVNDITVTLAPQPFCFTVQNLINANLDLSNAALRGCAVGVSQSFGIAGVASQNSLCANTRWEITATTTDVVTEARQTVASGARVLVSTDEVQNSCPTPPPPP